MATIEELLTKSNVFSFRGKRYKFLSYCPVPSIEMVNEDGEIFSFGITGQIVNEFILLSSPNILFYVYMHLLVNFRSDYTECQVKIHRDILLTSQKTRKIILVAYYVA